MNASTAIPRTVHIGRGRLLSLMGAVAVLAAAVTWALLVFALGAGYVSTAGVTDRGVAAGKAALDSHGPGVGVVGSLTPTEQSVSYYFFGASSSLTSAQLEAVHDYLFDGWNSLTPAERSVGSYLFGESESLTPDQRRVVHSYLVGASGR